jgi:hypothetical protein
MSVTGLVGQSSAWAKLDMTKPDATKVPVKTIVRSMCAKRIMVFL